MIKDELRLDYWKKLLPHAYKALEEASNCVLIGPPGAVGQEEALYCGPCVTATPMQVIQTAMLSIIIEKLDAILGKA